MTLDIQKFWKEHIEEVIDLNELATEIFQDHTRDLFGAYETFEHYQIPQILTEPSSLRNELLADINVSDVGEATPASAIFVDEATLF